MNTNSRRPLRHDMLPTLTERTHTLSLPTGSTSSLPYQRAKDLPRLIQVTDEMMRTPSRANRMMIIGLIENALRKERLRAQKRGSLYQIEKHQMLVQALNTERGKVASHLSAKNHAAQAKSNSRPDYKKRRLLLRDSVFKYFKTE